jgi:hypothetical protein
MKFNIRIYAIVTSVVIVLLLGILGYSVWTGNLVKEKVTSLDTELSNVNNELSRVRQQHREPAENINTYSMILRGSSSALVTPAVMTVQDLNQQQVSEIDKNIESITNTRVKEDIKSKWNLFVASKTINDYRTFISTVSDTITNEAGILRGQN